MKYLIILIILFTGCATAKKKTAGNCIDDVTERLCSERSSLLHKAPCSKLNSEQTVEMELAVSIFCAQAHNDPDLVMKLIESFRYTH